MKQEPIKIPEDWKFVAYKSIYSDEVCEGYLRPNGDIVDYFLAVIPAGWLILAFKKEVKEIVGYLETPAVLPPRPNWLQQATERLLPCPFCGGKAIMCGGLPNGHYRAKCMDCTASLTADRIDKAQGDWNARFLPIPVKNGPPF